MVEPAGGGAWPLGPDFGEDPGALFGVEDPSFGEVDPGVVDPGVVFGFSGWEFAFGFCVGELGEGVFALGAGELGGGVVAPGVVLSGPPLPGAGASFPGVADPGVCEPGFCELVPEFGDVLPVEPCDGDAEEEDPDVPDPCPALDPAPDPDPDPDAVCAATHTAPRSSTEKSVMILPVIDCLLG